MARKYRYTGDISFTQLEDIEAALLRAIKQYGEFKKDARELRWSFIDNIARELDELDGKGRSHHFKMLKHRELTKEHFKQIKE